MNSMVYVGFMNEFRITIPSQYPPTSPGHIDQSARQGYYVQAHTIFEAEATFRYNHPEYQDQKLDIQFWK